MCVCVADAYVHIVQMCVLYAIPPLLYAQLLSARAHTISLLPAGSVAFFGRFEKTYIMFGFEIAHGRM